MASGVTVAEARVHARARARMDESCISRRNENVYRIEVASDAPSFDAMQTIKLDFHTNIFV